MSMNMQTVSRTSNIRAVGLCHSVQGTFEQLMRYIGEKPSEVAFVCAGINHMAFYLSLQKNGEDLYPRLFQAMEDESIYSTNRVRFELMKRLGHFVTESSEHNAEYCSFFIPHGPERSPQYHVPIDEYLRRCDGIVDEFERLKVFSRSDEPIRDVHQSHEYCSVIMNRSSTGKPSVIYGNMPNGGTISSFPRYRDRRGSDARRSHRPAPRAGGRAAAAAGRRTCSRTSCSTSSSSARRGGPARSRLSGGMFDPLTAATLSMDQIVEMCDEMIAAYGDELPKLDKKTLVPTSGQGLSARSTPRCFAKAGTRRRPTAKRTSSPTWHVIGPFRSPEKGKISLDLATAGRGRLPRAQRRIHRPQGDLRKPRSEGRHACMEEGQSRQARDT